MGDIDANRWSEYNAAQSRRPVRPLARAAAELAGQPMGRTAVELGCGRGRESAFLADLGWQVRTFDSDPSVLEHLARLEEGGRVTHTQARLEDLDRLPECDLLLACASLPFIPRDHFPAVWSACVGALRPGAVLAVDLFGDGDDWAQGDGTFLTRLEVEDLARGLEVVTLAEDEYDGRSFSGPKHWHTYQLVARRP